MALSRHREWTMLMECKLNCDFEFSAKQHFQWSLRLFTAVPFYVRCLSLFANLLVLKVA